MDAPIQTIHNEHELKECTAALFALTLKGNPTGPEATEIGRLTALIEDYERTHYPLTDAPQHSF